MHGRPGRSWMSPAAKSEKNLLYVLSVAKFKKGVSVYTYEHGRGLRLMGMLEANTPPEGACVDEAGHVFITYQSLPGIIREYTHGVATPIATLTDPYGYPHGCSIDSTTGNLAVANSMSGPSQPGNIAIYANGSGTPTEYGDSYNLEYPFSCAYDNKGNLFVVAETRGDFALGELPHDGSSFTPITIAGGAIDFAMGIQRDGPNFLIGDSRYENQQHASAIYRVHVAGSTGTIVGTLRFSASRAFHGFWKDGDTIALGGKRTVYTNTFPEGVPISSIRGLELPWEMVVSPRSGVQ